MSEFDRMRLRLRQDVAQAGWPDPGEIRAQGSRRARRRVAVLAAVTAAVVLTGTVGVTTLVRESGHNAVPGITTSPSNPAATRAPTPSATAGPGATASGVPASGAVAWDMTFVSPTDGWLLVSSSCPAGLCPRIAHTTDGGASWTSLPALPAGVSTQAPGSNQVGLRFANSQVGYLYDPTGLYMTSDGGMTWAKQPGHADAIEIANGTVLRISSTTPQCAPGCTYQISRAPVGSSQWQDVATSLGGITGVGVQLLRTGRRVFAFAYRNLAGGVSAHGTLLTSPDDGTTWTARQDPCGSYQGAEAAGEHMAVADDGSMTMLCYLRGGSGGSLVVTTTDGGASFGPQLVAPPTTVTLGAASRTVLLAHAIDGETNRLYRSADGGASWAVVASAPETAPQGGGPPNEVAFQTSHAGWWLPGYQTVFSTTDGGQTWTQRRVP